MVIFCFQFSSYSAFTVCSRHIFTVPFIINKADPSVGKLDHHSAGDTTVSVKNQL